MANLNVYQKESRLKYLIIDAQSNIDILKTLYYNNVFKNAMVRIQEKRIFKLNNALKYLQRNPDSTLDFLYKKFKFYK